MIRSEVLKQLQWIAPILNEMELDDSASVSYSVLADGLFWSDEVPPGSIDCDEILRYLFKYRTSIILGSPDGTLEQLWLSAKQCFPKWPGFAESRAVPSKGMQKVYHDLSKAVFETFSESSDEYSGQ